MHIFFAGIGGSGIGPLAGLAKELGYDISGSELVESDTVKTFRDQGVEVLIGQTEEAIANLHARKPIDWYVYGSALPLENPNHPELNYVKQAGIKNSKRDQFLSKVITDKGYKLLAISGTHGKTTTAAMCVWLFNQLEIPISYSIGGQIMGGLASYQVADEAKWFIYEADEFDRNFLAFHPDINVMAGVTYDHHEIFPTIDDYQEAFRSFISQSKVTYGWPEDFQRLSVQGPEIIAVESVNMGLTVSGKVNKMNATLAIEAVAGATGKRKNELLEAVNKFPGVKRRFEQLVPNLYTDYAHTPEKIAGCLQTASELGKPVVAVYEPLTNRRQTFIKQQYSDLFAGVAKLYWLPSYIARESPTEGILSPSDLIACMNNSEVAEVAEMNTELLARIKQHLAEDQTVVLISGGGVGSLDSWAREQLGLLQA